MAELPSREMNEYFITRTNKHIERVGINLKKMYNYKGLTDYELNLRSELHDKSKFSPPEREGYVWLTWWHYCKNNKIVFNYPKGIEEIVKTACNHHLQNNAHHPESHSNVNKMSFLDITEMVCDWTAMSQEYLGSSCLIYALNNIDKWSFNQSRKDEIFETIEELDRRNAKLTAMS